MQMDILPLRICHNPDRSGCDGNIVDSWLRGRNDKLKPEQYWYAMLCMHLPFLLKLPPAELISLFILLPATSRLARATLSGAPPSFVRPSDRYRTRVQPGLKLFEFEIKFRPKCRL